MRAPYCFFGSINPRALLPVLLVVLLTAFTNLGQQAYMRAMP